jgi:hypothetical protein
MALAFRISPKRLTTNIQIILPTYLSGYGPSNQKTLNPTLTLLLDCAITLPIS